MKIDANKKENLKDQKKEDVKKSKKWLNGIKIHLHLIDQIY